MHLDLRIRVVNIKMPQYKRRHVKVMVDLLVKMIQQDELRYSYTAFVFETSVAS